MSQTDATAGADSVGINNNSVDKLKNDLSASLGYEIERIPVLKRGSDVPLYYTSSDDRLFEYDFDRIVFDKKTEYQQVRILHSSTLGNALFLDDLQNLAEGDLAYTQGLMNHPKLAYGDKEILILGGGDGGLLHELLKEKPKFVTMVDIDGVVMDSCRQHLRGACGSTLDNFEGDNYRVIVGDCLKYMEDAIGQNKTFDVVFNDLTDIPLSSEQSVGGSDLWAFIRRILGLAFKCLKPEGIYLNHAIGAGCVAALEEYESVLRNLEQKVTFSRHTAFVPSFLEEWVFYEIRKAEGC
jgi:spermine synthase